MRLLQCKIENFGKLNDASFDFTDGANIICKDNGWGKSTLAAFIRVMFFGFENQNKQDKLKNERKRYMPWQGGVYGGSVVFAVGDHTYVMRRVFGKKEKDDEYELRDATTNLPSYDYTDHIGEELFQIDGASFKRTIFISQLDCATTSTDMIHAKLSNLVENTDDINNFQTVYDRLKDQTNKMAPNRKTGSLYKEKQIIADMEQDVRGEDTILRSMKEVEQLRSARVQHKKDIEDEMKELKLRQAKLSESLDMQVQKKEYDTYKSACQQASKGHADSIHAFPDPDHIPSIAQVDQWIEYEQNCHKIHDKMLSSQLTDEEKKSYRDLEAMFAHQVPTEADIDTMESARAEWERLGIEMESNDTDMASGTDNYKDPKIYVAGGIIGIAVITGITATLSIPVACIVAIVLIALMCSLGYTNTKKARATQADKQEAMRQNQKKKDRYDLLGNKMSEFMKLYYKKDITSDQWSRCLSDMKEKILNYQRWQPKVQAYDEATKSYGEVYTRLKDSMGSYGFGYGDIDLQSIRNQVDHCERARASLDKAETLLKRYEESHDIARIGRMNGTREDTTLSDLDDQMTNARNRLDDIDKSIAGYDQQLMQYEERLDDVQNKKVELDTLREDYGEHEKKYNLILKTMEYLQEAKDSLTSRYIGPVQRGFDKYYQKITGDEAVDYKFDANADLTVYESGMSRETRFLSDGRRDLVGICTRLALVDAMYGEEKPFIIMDDPFVNLDDSKTEQAKVFLQEIAREYQVIYFTCSEGRVLY